MDEKDYQASLTRWMPFWEPVFEVSQVGSWFGIGFRRWRVAWTGPLGGEHVNYGLTRASAIQNARQEIAYWTVKRRRAEKKRRERLGTNRSIVR